MSGLEPRLKLWLECDGRVAFSDYRARLLRRVQESGSLAQAAAATSLSYRRAWGKVRELEENLGVAVLESDVGGVGGGRSRLTPAGADLLARYERFAAAVAEAADALYERHFPEAGASGSGQAGEQVEPIADHAVRAPLDQR
ncbi:MAG TPA: LysR family transcriptional regulator [Dehalococcoidia bacterium]|nr:LysR family transcriptional regulator [Dehalococcoidia bacterium]